MSYYPDEPQRPKDPPTEIAKGLALMAGGGAAAWLAGDAGLPPLWWWIAVACGIAAAVGGFAYAASIALEWVAFSWPSWQEQQNGHGRPSGEAGRPDAPAGDAETVEGVGRGAMPYSEDDTTRFETYNLLSNDRIRINNQVVDIPNFVDVDHLIIVAEEREVGNLPDISPNSLHELNISRFGGDSAPAKLLIYFLEQIGAVEDMGERRPYKWTDRGEKLFPDLTAPPPRHNTGTNGSQSYTGARLDSTQPRPHDPT